MRASEIELSSLYASEQVEIATTIEIIDYVSVILLLPILLLRSYGYILFDRYSICLCERNA